MGAAWFPIRPPCSRRGGAKLVDCLRTSARPAHLLDDLLGRVPAGEQAQVCGGGGAQLRVNEHHTSAVRLYLHIFAHTLMDRSHTCKSKFCANFAVSCFLVHVCCRFIRHQKAKKNTSSRYRFFFYLETPDVRSPSGKFCVQGL